MYLAGGFGPWLFWSSDSQLGLVVMGRNKFIEGSRSIGSLLEIFIFFLSRVNRKSFFFFFVFLSFLGPYPQHMEVPRLGELFFFLSFCLFWGHTHSIWKFPGRATATWNLSHICDLHRSSQQRWILNPLSEAGDWTCNLMVPSQVHNHWATTGTPIGNLFVWGWNNNLVGSSCCGAVETNPPSIHEEAGLIPALDQWVGDLVSWAVVADMAGIQCCWGCGVGWQLQLRFNP